MPDYKVNLPKTNFPMKADLARREPEFLKLWEENKLAEKVASFEYKKKGKFILHDGPPYANGEIHLGHAVNKILKDIALKAHMLNGEQTPYVPGWDCHGLPIELNVEKKYGRAGDKITKEEFITKCRNYAAEQVALQRDAFMRLGVLGDWCNPYCTMFPKYEANTIRALGKIIENGYIGRGFKPVHWCAVCGSALAEAEVEYIDKESPAIDVRFQLVAPEKLLTEFQLEQNSNISIPIWTTTPWTLPANEAVCVHPNLEYVIIKSFKNKELLIIIKDLLENIVTRYGISDYTVLATFTGKKLEGVKLRHPFLKHEVPIICGEHVTVDAGTGAVHTAPAHGMDDYKVGIKYSLPVNNPVDAHGRFLKDTAFTKEFPEFAGEKVFDANAKIISLLKDRGNLVHEEKITHSYPHCWRHKKPLIFRATQQWFVFMDKIGVNSKTLRQMALETIKNNVKWLSPHGEARIKEMVQNRPDWCISRQRIWGTPITLLVHKTTGELHPDWQKILEQVATGVERDGIEFWHKYLPEQSPDYEKTTDTLDVWFDAGVSHYCVPREHPELTFPADLYFEGADQYRGWFQSSLLTALAIDGKAPYKTVNSHGFTVDADGRKMSKSVGNIIAPRKIIDTLGADILRLWVASVYLHDDLTISDEILARNVDKYREFRNTVRFLLGNLADFDPGKNLVTADKMFKLDVFAVQEVLKHATSTKISYNEYPSFHTVSLAPPIGAESLSSWYFSIIKDSLYTLAPNSPERRSTQTALYYILEALVRLAAPILSFTAEEIWQEMRRIWPKQKRAESIFLSEWYKCELKSVAVIPCNLWEDIQFIGGEVNKEIEKLRAQGIVGSSLEAEVIIYCSEEKLSQLLMLDVPLKFILITSSAEAKLIGEKDAKAVATTISDLWITVTKSPHPKCPRCWHRCPDIGVNALYPELCGRCASQISGIA